jgi:hypothetical protein
VHAAFHEDLNRKKVLNNDLRVFGIGLSRTGTTSLTKALTMLGIRAQHYPNDKTTQEELKRGQYNLSVLKDIQALTDIPVSPFYPQFDALFPQSKFILTTRPTDEWLGSVDNHFRLYVAQRRDDFDDFVFACVYGSLHFSAERFAYVKELHERDCRAYFAGRPEKLLVLDLVRCDDPWGELCRFLDCPLPEEPFPHENKRRTYPARRVPTGLLGKLRSRLRRL